MFLLNVGTHMLYSCKEHIDSKILISQFVVILKHLFEEFVTS